MLSILIDVKNHIIVKFSFPFLRGGGFADCEKKNGILRFRRIFPESTRNIYLFEYLFDPKGRG